MAFFNFHSCQIRKMVGIYNEMAQSEDPYRNPVILIPGTMGSRLETPAPTALSGSLPRQL